MKASSGKLLQWTLLGAAAIALLIWILNLMWGHPHGMHGGFQPAHSGFGQHGLEGRGVMRGYMDRGGFDKSGSDLAYSLFFKIAFILFGLLLWRIGKNALKWFGVVLFVIGLFTLMPFFLAAAVTAAIGYIIYRIHRSNRMQPLAIEPVTPVIHTTAIVGERDIIDEWEQSIHKEEK
ncbi:hypothetical protein DCC85_02895 [Paenibacillus sp. CAA11]|uniref:hypothetical protein n=1 Tax=Paenibacillus sp. CAA11 TaxID=1532905 RepID=UPI000D3530DC|nr:hypothetical protein [Paenibacillus sp. CAA11]AWB43278.1 hypothetical protein DCC85_02895 [Paenibacillus sp. CAA11]